MKRIVLRETRESISDWNSLDEVRHWATVNLFPMHEENGRLIVEANEFDGQEMGRVPVLCEFRIQDFIELSGGCLQSVEASATLAEGGAS